MRNVLWHTSSKYRDEVAHEVKLILWAPDIDEARRRLEAFRERFAKIAPKAVAAWRRASRAKSGYGSAREV